MGKHGIQLQKGWDERMYGFGKYDAQNRYDEWNTVQVKLKLNKNTDRDILKWIDGQKYGRGTSVQGAIKALIRQELARLAADTSAEPSNGT